MSPQSLALFCLLIPHFNSYGKMNGNPHFIKGEVAPLIDWLDVKEIRKCLAEITNKTNVKWFKINRIDYLHSLSWNDHQDLIRRKGADLLPDYSGINPVVVPPELELELELELEGKEEGKGEGKKGAGSAKPKPAKLSDREWIETLKKNPAYKGIDIEKLQGKMLAWCDLKSLKPTRKRLLNWLNREDLPMGRVGKTEKEKIEEWVNEPE